MCQSWFLSSQRDNFHLTPEVKANFTEKLGETPREFFVRKVKQIVRPDGGKEFEKLSVAAKRWIFE